MNSEYVRVSIPERLYSVKGLLRTQLATLNALQAFRNYKKLRNDEFLLRISIKNEVESCITLLMQLEKVLPQTAYQLPSEREKKQEPTNEEKEELSLNDEIQMIKRKLSALQASA